MELNQGDIIVFPHGDAHMMSSARGLQSGPNVHSVGTARYLEPVMLGNGGPRAAAFVCGFLGCDRRPFNPLLAGLPRLMHMRGMSGAWVSSFTRQVTEESQLRRAGADSVLTRLAELMFIEVLRRYLGEQPSGQSWVARGSPRRCGGPGPGPVARAAGSSLDPRRVGTQGSFFPHQCGEALHRTGWPAADAVSRPMAHAGCRQSLSQSGAKVAAIAAQVGYDSEAAFSRAFKKATGEAPGAWREARRSGVS